MKSSRRSSGRRSQNRGFETRKSAGAAVRRGEHADLSGRERADGRLRIGCHGGEGRRRGPRRRSGDRGPVVRQRGTARRLTVREVAVGVGVGTTGAAGTPGPRPWPGSPGRRRQGRRAPASVRAMPDERSMRAATGASTHRSCGPWIDSRSRASIVRRSRSNRGSAMPDLLERDRHVVRSSHLALESFQRPVEDHPHVVRVRAEDPRDARVVQVVVVAQDDRGSRSWVEDGHGSIERHVVRRSLEVVARRPDIPGHLERDQPVPRSTQVGEHPVGHDPRGATHGRARRPGSACAPGRPTGTRPGPRPWLCPGLARSPRRSGTPPRTCVRRTHRSPRAPLGTPSVLPARATPCPSISPDAPAVPVPYRSLTGQVIPDQSPGTGDPLKRDETAAENATDCTPSVPTGGWDRVKHLSPAVSHARRAIRRGKALGQAFVRWLAHPACRGTRSVPNGGRAPRPTARDGGRSRRRRRATMAGMDFALTPELEALRERARRYVVDVLQPLEVEFERPAARLAPSRRASCGGGDRGRPRRRRTAQGARRARVDEHGAGRRPRAVRAGDRRPVVATCRARTTCWSCATPTSAGATWSRACAASASAATRSPSRTPARTRGPSRPPPSATRPPGSGCSTARSGSSPGPTTPTS